MKDYSIYKHYKGEQESPYLKKLDKHITKSEKFYNEYNIPNDEVARLEALNILWEKERTFSLTFPDATYYEWSLALGEYSKLIKGFNGSLNTIPPESQKREFLNAFMTMYFETRGKNIRKYY